MMSAPSKIKKKKAGIYIVDDHPVIRQCITQLVNQQDDMFSVGEAASALEAVQGIEQKKPDLVTMDISLGGTNGIELTEMILASQPEILVLMLSMHDESVYAERILQIGARGYLQKRDAASLIIVAIRQVLDGQIYLSDKWKARLVRQSSGRDTAINHNLVKRLSDRDNEVMRHLGLGYSAHKIADELAVSVKTIESHCAHIKKKLNLNNSHKLIQFAVKRRLSET